MREIVTCGSFERSIRRLRGEDIPEPTPEMIWTAIQNIMPAYYQRVILEHHQKEQEGIFRPNGLGVDFLRYVSGGRTCVDLYSPEDLKFITDNPYRFSTTVDTSSHPLYGLEHYRGKFQLWKAGISPQVEIELK